MNRTILKISDNNSYNNKYSIIKTIITVIITMLINTTMAKMLFRTMIIIMTNNLY